jgi:MFS transporter, FSR family, fosmidomycin resistance protein
MLPRPRFLTGRLAVLTIGHLTIDAYSSFFLPLLPLLVQRLGLNYAMVGGLTAIASLSSSFSQPLFGLAADRMRRPLFVALGPLLAAVFMAAVGIAQSYTVLVLLLVVGGLGVSMFHPQTASLAGSTSGKRGMAMSFWVTGGTLGWALGPAFATSVVGTFGFERSWLAAIPGVVMCGFLFAWLARVPPHAAARQTTVR